jgi:hypothetical protein
MRKSKPDSTGRCFEEEVEGLLRSAGFRVQPNAGAARPRQTDLYATGHGMDLLVEVKDRKRKVDINDVDGLRSRLGRTAADIIGVIVTTSEVSSGALREIEADRTREILVLAPNEVELLRQHRADLLVLIQRKRHELRSRGRAWIGPVVGREHLGVRLPRSPIRFQCKEKKPYFASKGGHVHMAFAMEIPDPGWGTSGGNGVVLSLQLTLGAVEDLQETLGYLHQNFGLSTHGAFTIRQSEMCWHGVGAHELLQTVRNYEARYRAATMSYVHHSEEITYVDRFRGGYLMLTTQHHVKGRMYGTNRGPVFNHSELAIALPGIPLDTRQFLDLCRYTGNDWGEFENVPERHCRTRRLRKALRLEVVGTVVEIPGHQMRALSKHRTVVGVIAKNPFYGKRSLPPELQDKKIPLHDLLRTELLLCDLRDWHDEGDVIDFYVLEGFESTFIHAGQLVRPFGTWNEVLKRAAKPKDERQQDRNLKRLVKELDSEVALARKR